MLQSNAFFKRFVLLSILLLPAAADAVLVEHHGTMVESRGTVRDCISCHDGSTASNVAVCTTQCTTSTEHSVLKLYPTGGRQTEKFRPLSEVKSKRIKIVRGRVTCISCHNLRNQKKFHLVMDNNNSRLCLSCHIN